MMPAGGETRGTRLVLLPGMGVDGRLFAPQRRAFPRLEVPAWLEPRGRESLAEYARRFAETVGAGRDLFLGGVSFGGMVALELARHVRPRAVFLIASCRSGRHIHPAWHVVERSLRHFPDAALRALVGPSARFVAWRNDLRGTEARRLCDMAAETSIAFLRWAGPAALAWPGPPAGSIPCPVHQVHGAQDPLIALVPGDADLVIPEGRHLINVTHAELVNAFVRARIREALALDADRAAAAGQPAISPDNS